jgi:branched-chain amino acid transport system substrate-binding protein
MEFRDMKYLKIGALAAATVATARNGAAIAEDTAYIPTFVYRTGAYAPNGIPIANGFKDHFTLLNERDGGIEGVRIVHEECETNYDTKVGVECYERLKSNNRVDYQSVLYRHYLRADPQSTHRQDSDTVHGIRAD